MYAYAADVLTKSRSSEAPAMQFNVSDSEGYMIQICSPSEGVIIPVSYIVVATLGIVFNTMLCTIILRNRHLRTIVNLLVLNLAVANIMACLNIFPFLYFHIQDTNFRGTSANMLCGISEGLSIFFVGASVSIQTLSVLSISRYLVIHRPSWFPWRLKKGNIKSVVGLVWLLSTALVIPNFVSFVYDEEKKCCDKSWAHGVNPIAYLTATAIFNVIIPLSSLLVTYFTTICTLWFKNSESPTASRSQPYVISRNNMQIRNLDSTLSSKSNNGITQSSKRVQRYVVILLGMLTGVYLACWVPFVVYWLLATGTNYFDYAGSQEDLLRSTRLCRTVILVAMCSTVLNPLTYVCTNSNLRSAFKKMFKSQKVTSFLAQRATCDSSSATVFHLKRMGNFNRGSSQ